MKQAAAAAAGGQQYPSAALYVVATPIGNLADLTLRAVHVLGLVDAVACEDSRVTGALMHHLSLDKPLIALHEHNEHAATQLVLGRLAGGQRVAYASDAGTPALCDPGAWLVSQVAQAGHRVIPIPGPSSGVTAFSVAGDRAAAGFRFGGFFPGKGGEREQAIHAACCDPMAQIWFEAPHRIVSLMAALAVGAPERLVTICRELTKQFETVATMPASEGPVWLAADANHQRGEFVIVLHAMPTAAPEGGLPPTALAALDTLMSELPLKQAVALAARLTHEPRNALYQAALKRRGDAPV